jgi:hypothetical protein
MSEIWFDSAGARWPLFGAFALVFFLLLAWNLSYLRNREVLGHRTDLAIVVFNSIALLAIGVALFVQVRASSIRFYYEKNEVAWNVSRSTFRRENTCELAAEYLGTWQVMSRENPTLAQDFPAGWITFHRNLTFDAANSKMSASESGHWSPNEWMPIIWLSSDTWGDSIWEPSFSEDGTLVLATPAFEPDPVTTVTLRRLR